MSFGVWGGTEKQRRKKGNMLRQRLGEWFHSLAGKWRGLSAGAKRVWASIAAVAMVVGTVVAVTPSAQAQDTKIADPTTYSQWEQGVGNVADAKSTGEVWTDKSVSTGSTTVDGVTVSPDSSDEFLVGLSALSSVEQIIGAANHTKPLDVTLVLDTSGAMAFDMDGNEGTWFNPIPTADQRITALKNALAGTDGFLDAMAASNDGVAQGKENRVALITYASTATDYTNGYVTTFNEVKNDINGLKATGATRADLGLETAKNLVTSSKARADATKIVIFFTDGMPTSDNGFKSSTAETAIGYAKNMKDAGATIYSVGIFSGAKPSQSIENVTEGNASDGTDAAIKKANNFM
ncbi:MAG: vWA domain-containing protein [Bifidobacterium sp.]|nr:vWA domain-containing protein [Bifidobacterium sp.]